MSPSKPPETGARLPGVNVNWLGDQASNDEWYTPPFFFAAMTRIFDLDPCTIPGGLPWIPAKRTYSIEDDGLTAPWEGTVWLNPPYSKPAPWVARLAEHGDGIALLPADTSTAWWHDHIAGTATSFVFVKGRVRFVKADLQSSTSWTGRFPSVLVGYGEKAMDTLSTCGLGWFISDRFEHTQETK